MMPPAKIPNSNLILQKKIPLFVLHQKQSINLPETFLFCSIAENLFISLLNEAEGHSMWSKVHQNSPQKTFFARYSVLVRYHDDVNALNGFLLLSIL